MKTIYTVAFNRHRGVTLILTHGRCHIAATRISGQTRRISAPAVLIGPTATPSQPAWISALWRAIAAI